MYECCFAEYRKIAIRKLKTSDWRSMCLIADDFKKRLGFGCKALKNCLFIKMKTEMIFFLPAETFF